MTIKVKFTSDEVARLAYLEGRMKDMDQQVRTRPATELAQRMANDLSELERLTRGTRYANLVDREVKTSMAWVFNASRLERGIYDAYVAEYNDILKTARDRCKAQAERIAVRAAMCDRCFLIHRRGQIECE